MIREAAAVTVRQNLGEMLNEVQYRGDSIVITRDGKKVAALVDIQLFENIRRMRAEFDRMCAKFAEAGEGLSEAEVESLVSEAVAETRADLSPARRSCKGR